jgi:hypothetical protein
MPLMYELKPEDFSDIDKESVQEEGIIIISPNESENEVNKENINSSLVVEKRFRKLSSGIAQRGKYRFKRVL